MLDQIPNELYLIIQSFLYNPVNSSRTTNVHKCYYNILDLLQFQYINKNCHKLTANVIKTSHEYCTLQSYKDSICSINYKVHILPRRCEYDPYIDSYRATCYKACYQTTARGFRCKNKRDFHSDYVLLCKFHRNKQSVDYKKYPTNQAINLSPVTFIYNPTV